MAYTKQTLRILRLQSDPVYTNGGANPQAVPMQFVVASRLANDANANDVVEGKPQTISVDLLDPAITDLTIAGANRTFGQLAVLIRQAALDRANAAGIS
jgi:hypothetical protein